MADKIDDGGPAFARAATFRNLPDGRQTGTNEQDGMTLRDYFAGQALLTQATLIAAAMAGGTLTAKTESGDIDEAALAEGAYALADAMLTERAKGGQ